MNSGAPQRQVRIGADAAGLRLDRALAGLTPEGLRGRRRRIAGGGVLLNGKPCLEAARHLRAGDVVTLAPAEAPSETPEAQARLLGRQGDFCFLFKGAGLHSAALAGKAADSLEARLPALCAPVSGPDEKPELLQRLDEMTSGIVCAALTPEAARAFRAAEAAGECEKRYLALLTGALAAPMTARWRLDTSGRRTTRLMNDEAGPVRWTEFHPLHVWEGEPCGSLCALPGAASAPSALTLAGCRIRRGARHQIRAHAAGLGHPLYGDTRYAGAPSAAPGRFFLHHGLLAWPGHACSAPPPWPWLAACLPEDALDRARAWLEPG